jgi:hypothetical protein
MLKSKSLRYACMAALAFGANLSSGYSLPKAALLKRVDAGAVVSGEGPFPAADLWKKDGAVVLVVRRSG